MPVTPQIGTVEAGAEDAAVWQSQLLHDVVLHARSGGRCECHQRHPGKPAHLLLLPLLPSKIAITQHKACALACELVQNDMLPYHLCLRIRRPRKSDRKSCPAQPTQPGPEHRRTMSGGVAEKHLQQARGHTAVCGHQAVQGGLVRHPRRTRSGPHPPRSGRGCRRGASHPARASTCRWPPPALSLPLSAQRTADDHLVVCHNSSTPNMQAWAVLFCCNSLLRFLRC